MHDGEWVGFRRRTESTEEGNGNRTGRVEERERRTNIDDTKASAAADAGHTMENAETGGVGERARARGAGRMSVLHQAAGDDAKAVGSSRGATAARDVAGGGDGGNEGSVGTRRGTCGGARAAGAGDDAKVRREFRSRLGDRREGRMTWRVAATVQRSRSVGKGRGACATTRTTLAASAARVGVEVVVREQRERMT
ncbi:hypothetical protein FB451DRAFT_1486986 [Mycena latifolia]|nr:hypothetical protein FB451DRAFT_1486986 [Mycena latifolia]